MELKLFYEDIGGDYNTVLSRFVGNEALLKRFVLLFKDDKIFSDLETAMKNNDVKEIELHAHSLKGVTANLGFEGIHKASAELNDSARDGNTSLFESQFETIKREYAIIMEKIHQLN